MKLLKYQQLPLNPAGNPAGNRFSTTETALTTFQIKSTNIYVPAVTLSIHDDIKFLQNIKQGYNI